MLKIKTERLIITPMENDELRELVKRYEKAIPELSVAYQEMLDNCLKFPQAAVWYTAWKICLADSMEEVGFAGFKGIDNGHVEIGYGINEGHEGNGYATEAVKALCNWALGSAEVTAVEAETDIDNKASQKVLARAGFTPTGKNGEEGPEYIMAAGQGYFC